MQGNCIVWLIETGRVSAEKAETKKGFGYKIAKEEVEKVFG